MAFSFGTLCWGSLSETTLVVGLMTNTVVQMLREDAEAVIEFSSMRV